MPISLEVYMAGPRTPRLRLIIDVVAFITGLVKSAGVQGDAQAVLVANQAS